MRYLSPILVVLSAPLGLFSIDSPANFNFDPTQAANNASFPKPPDTKSSVPGESSPHDVISSTFQSTLSRPLIDLLSSSKITPWPEFSFRLGNVAFQLVAFVDAASSYLRSNGKENDAKFFDKVKDSISRLIAKHPSSPATPQLSSSAPVPPTTTTATTNLATNPPDDSEKTETQNFSPSELKPQQEAIGVDQEATATSQPPAISTTPLAPLEEQTENTTAGENPQKTESKQENNEEANAAVQENNPNAEYTSASANKAGEGSEANSGSGDKNPQQDAANQDKQEEPKDESPFGDAFSM